MTNGEKLKEVFPNMRIDVFVSYVQVVGENYEFNNLYPLKWWNAEYKESNTKNDLEIVIDAMEYRTNSLIENIKSEILHFANAHCSGDDINIYDVFKVIDDCCEAENLTTKNDIALIHTEGLDEGIRCAMCTNSIKSDRGCDGGCVVNNAMYKKVMDVIENHIVDTDKMVEPTTKNDLGVQYRSLEDIKKLVESKADDLDGVMLDASGVIIGLYFAIANDLPSVTPQESRIITCKDCKYYRNKGNKRSYCTKRLNVDSVTDRYREPNFYCADAVLREVEE